MRPNVLFALDDFRAGDTFADAVRDGVTARNGGFALKRLWIDD